MTRSRCAHKLALVSMLAGLCAASPAAAATTVVTGFTDPAFDYFDFFLSAGKYFKLDLGSAPVVQFSLQNAGFVVIESEIWTDVTPAGFDTLRYDTPVEFNCVIGPGESCAQDQFGPTSIALRNEGALSFGSHLLGPGFDRCFDPASTPIAGVECSRNIFSDGMAFEVIFAERGSFAYRLTISDSPIGAIPEPASWALLILGFGVVGAATRHARRPRYRLA